MSGLFERPPDFGLENHDKHDQRIVKHDFQQIFQGGELQQVCHPIRDPEQTQALEQLFRPGIAHQFDQAVYSKGH